MDSCRRALEALADGGGPCDHVGLALHRYLRRLADDHAEARRLLDRLAASSANEAYLSAFSRWQAATSNGGVCAFVGEALSPIAVGLGNESVLEASLTLHHTYGTPLLPGSALKGLCRRVAAQDGGLGESHRRVVFGAEDAESASHLTFWDAWYVPDRQPPLKADVVTVHHPGYYQQKGRGVWPTDFDDPNPVPFLVVRPGVRFLFKISGPGEWPKLAASLLQWGLENLGIGGKTNAGYGYLGSFQPVGEEAAAPPSSGGPTPRGPGAKAREVWDDCLLERRRTKQGGVYARIYRGERYDSFQQSVWQRFDETLTSVEKSAADKKRLVVTVTVEYREGSPIPVDLKVKGIQQA